MPNAMTASALALVSLVGIVLGIDLGRSTIAHINPAYYSSPPPGHLYAELTPAGYRSGTGDEVSTDVWPADDPVALPECGDCTAAATIDRYADPRPGAEPAWQPSEPLPQVIRGVPQGQIDRYMQFPVTQEEALKQDRQKEPSYARRDGGEDTKPVAEPQPDGL